MKQVKTNEKKIDRKNEEIKIRVESFYSSEGSGLAEMFSKVIYDELKQKIA
jgi:hypothetical protein